jgi:hypothetical protein
MKRAIIPIAVTLLSGLATVQCAFAQGGFTVVPFEFDPFGTHLVAAEWKGGLGCPNGATSTSDGVTFTTVNDSGCPTIDPRDGRIEGLLLAKTGLTTNYAAAGADIKGVEGMMVSELGYDIRKGGAPASIIGSHCGAGAPRFDVITQDDVDHFVGCASPPPVVIAASSSWTRLIWLPAQAFPPILPTDTIKSLSIIFDEGTDTGSDFFGAAVLDNIDVNGVRVGRGPRKNADEDEGGGRDSDHDNFQFEDSPSHPESSNMEYHDPSKGMNMQSVNGARSISYNGACVSFVTDTILNGNPGYLATFAACDVSGILGMGIGTYSITVTGPLGFLYQKNAALTSGYVSIHPH